MRVLLIVTGLPDKKYPARSVYNINFAKALISKGHEVEILYIRSFNSNRFFIKKSIFNGLKVTEIPCFIPLGKANYFPLFVFLYKLYSKKADIVHAVNGGAVTIANSFANHWKVPLVTQFIGSDVNFSLEKSLKNNSYKTALSGTSFFTFNSEALKLKFDSLYKTETPSQVLYRGIDLSSQIEKNNIISNNHISFLYLGGFPSNNTNLKGGLTLLQSLKIIDRKEHSNCTFYIGGPNSQNYIHHSQFDFIKVQYIGAIDKSEVQSYLEKCNIVIIPSLNEGVPNMLFEAMANSKVTIATKVGGIPEVLTSDAGILIEPDNAEMLASEIKRVCSSNYDLQNMSKSAYRRIKDFSYSKFIDGYTNIYHQLINIEKK